MLARLKSLHRYIVNLDVGVLIAVATLLVASYVFFEVVDEVTDGEAQHVDERIVNYIRTITAPEWVEEFMRDCTAFGGMLMLALVTAAVSFYLVLRKQYHALVFLLSAVVGAALLSMALKGMFQRERPDILVHRSHTMTTSFPSGHAMLSAAVWLTLGVLLSRLERSRYVKAYFILLGVFISFLVGISRVWLGVHWPSDVLAGWMAGTFWALFCWFVLRYLQQHGQVEPPTAAVDAPDDEPTPPATRPGPEPAKPTVTQAV